jgi:hypothetical protein
VRVGPVRSIDALEWRIGQAVAIGNDRRGPDTLQAAFSRNLNLPALAGSHQIAHL